MAEKIYNKLVRDKIPEIIRNDNKKCEVEIVNSDELKDSLNKKLVEEVEEYLESHDIEELADILEVIYGILESKGVSREELEEIRKKKRDERGGFSDGVRLVKVFE
ncbi:nucleoside triphosphate pyrophosphohydrolase [Dethiothermospora halolimnae]|uniref:nucleoside triphosphate pyrophosphohydrolase n=1 Tax=Dethiothermospora halolimnae TaxID=3114390 RepID=UPI003CCC23DC